MPEANANPEKRFFIDLITRDISLEDAILDLIDNAIDSLIRTRAIDPYQDLIHPEDASDKTLAEIKIKFTAKQFEIVDNCGGITFERAEKDIFRFGHPDPHEGASLSVFGIGMKRAFFKIGRELEMKSNATNSGFFMKLDVDEWLGKTAIDWKIPIEEESGEQDVNKAGTKIVISKLKDEIVTLTANPTFEYRVVTTISETYPFYLGKYLRIYVNEKEVEGEDLTFAESTNLKPTIERWEDGNVKATLICGFLPSDRWHFAKSGWYLVCNGRVVVHADRTKLTGWGPTLPQFMPKHRGFLGIVFFKSGLPEELPWNTTKRGIDTESAVFIRTRKRIVAASRPVIRLQNKMYEASESDAPKEEYRESVRDLHSSSATEKAAQSEDPGKENYQQRFIYNPPTVRPKITAVQFKVKKEDMQKVKKRLGRLSMSNKEAGERVFKYFMDRECSE